MVEKYSTGTATGPKRLCAVGNVLQKLADIPKSNKFPVFMQCIGLALSLIPILNSINTFIPRSQILKFILLL
jgi:hypothetical protein